MNLDNCRECKESKCIMSKYYGLNEKEIQEYNDEVKYKERVKNEYNRKSKEYYINETEYYEKLKIREDKLTDYKRMNKSDWIHQNIWDLAMKSQIELQTKYYSNIKY